MESFTEPFQCVYFVTSQFTISENKELPSNGIITQKKWKLMDRRKQKYKPEHASG